MDMPVTGLVFLCEKRKKHIAALIKREIASAGSRGLVPWRVQGRAPYALT